MPIITATKKPRKTTVIMKKLNGNLKYNFV